MTGFVVLASKPNVIKTQRDSGFCAWFVPMDRGRLRTLESMGRDKAKPLVADMEDNVSLARVCSAQLGF